MRWRLCPGAVFFIVVVGLKPYVGRLPFRCLFACLSFTVGYLERKASDLMIHRRHSLVFQSVLAGFDVRHHNYLELVLCSVVFLFGEGLLCSVKAGSTRSTNAWGMGNC